MHMKRVRPGCVRTPSLNPETSMALTEQAVDDVSVPDVSAKQLDNSGFFRCNQEDLL